MAHCCLSSHSLEEALLTLFSEPLERSSLSGVESLVDLPFSREQVKTQHQLVSFFKGFARECQRIPATY